MKNTSRSLFGLLAVIAFAVCVLFVLSIYERHRASVFLRDFASVQIGKTTFAEMQDLASRYEAKASGTRVQDPCSVHNCIFDFIFTNWIFNHLQRQREISLTASIVVKDGYVTGRELDYSIFATSADHQFMYIVFDQMTPEKDRGYAIKQGMVNAQGSVHIVEVHLGSNVSAEVRKRAYSIDLGCLSRVSGCDTLRDILPIYWRDLEAGGPLKPGFGLSGDVPMSQTWSHGQTRLSSCPGV